MQSLALHICKLWKVKLLFYVALSGVILYFCNVRHSQKYMQAVIVGVQ